MYVPASFRNDDPARLREFVQRYPFANLIGHDGELPVTTLLPVLYRPDDGGGVLVTHLARANPHWRLCDGVRRAVVQFAGPHAYVSPSWYTTQPAVPTWNYTVVQAVGRPAVVDDEAWLRAQLAALMARFDPDYDLPDDLLARLLPAIVGIEMRIESWSGKFKLGQNRGADDQRGVIDGLYRAGDPESVALAEFMTAELAGG